MYGKEWCHNLIKFGIFTLHCDHWGVVAEGIYERNLTEHNVIHEHPPMANCFGATRGRGAGAAWRGFGFQKKVGGEREGRSDDNTQSVIPMSTSVCDFDNSQREGSMPNLKGWTRVTHESVLLTCWNPASYKGDNWKDGCHVPLPPFNDQPGVWLPFLFFSFLWAVLTAPNTDRNTVKGKLNIARTDHLKSKWSIVRTSPLNRPIRLRW